VNRGLTAITIILVLLFVVGRCYAPSMGLEPETYMGKPV